MKWIAAMFLCLALSCTAFAQKKIPIVIDTDIGADIDDAFALALAIASPEMEIRGITTVGRGAGPDPYVQYLAKDRDEDRAWLVGRFLAQCGITGIPVAAGANPQPKSPIDWQIQYRRHPAVVYNRSQKPVKETAVELMARLANEADGGLTIIAIGPLTNVARLVKEQPAAAKKIKRIVLMGGSVAIGYEGKPKPEPEWNMETDIAAARTVFKSGVPLTVIPLDVTATLKLEKKQREAIFSAHTPLTWQVQNLYELWDRETPILFDPAAVMAAFDDSFFTFDEMYLEISDTGMTLAKELKPNCRVARTIQRTAFLDSFSERLRSVGKETLPAPPKNPSKFIEPGLFPGRVHAFEDYETSIEKRWWMGGKIEKNAPRAGRRAMRAVLTQDFDDRQGNMAAMYRAVIFNPVPGPPMGPHTQLRFKYKLTGTDTIRVQLYSLTNGYHRYLSVSKLDEGKWQSGCVDMTQMRRPDGSGGPLAAHERIDDIQIYIDPRAELLIDDVVLYEAAAKGETRPFPKRILYTGLFDTGKQGKEWPGDFQIVDHEKPRAGKAAKSVARKSGESWIRLDLKGERLLDRRMELTFKYKLDAKNTLKAELYHRGEGKVVAAQSTALPGNEWGEQTLRFTVLPETPIDEIRFLLPSGELLIDDVLLYTPGG
jgi:inosine-uridine nucleoside N-ribohydrolase